MFKNLNCRSLGVSGRQSELIELTLTYGFKGLDVDMQELVKRAENSSAAYAARFMQSAKLDVGTFELPVRFHAQEPAYKADVANIPKVIEVAKALGARRCITTVSAVTSRAYNEEFDLLTARLNEVAALLGEGGIRLGLGFNAAPIHRAGNETPFIYQAEPLLALIKTIGSPQIGLMLDTWNWKAGDGGLDQIAELDISKIIGVRLADLPAGHDPAKLEEKQRVMPGEGEGSMAQKLVQHLHSQGYEGPVAIFLHPSLFAGMTRDSIVQKAANKLEEYWISVGLSKPKPVAVAAKAKVQEVEDEDFDSEDEE